MPINTKEEHTPGSKGLKPQSPRKGCYPNLAQRIS